MIRKGLFTALLLGLALSCSFVTADVKESSMIQGLTTGLGANDLGDIVWDGSSLWVEGSGTLTNLVGEGHKVTDWISFKDIEGFGKGTISAFYASGDTLVTAWGYYAPYNDSYAPVGDGLSISVDRGMNWHHVTILDLFPDREGLGTPGRYTTTYDIEVEGRTIWCSTTAGFLLKSGDFGQTWTNILPYDEPFNFSNPNHHGQCVDVYGDTLWVGTFQGMNASFDKGKTWKNFSWPLDGSGNREIDQWPGNFPVAVEHKVVDGKTHVWVASQEYFGLGRYGICHTSDNGNTWKFEKYLDEDSKPWNFAFGHKGASDPAVSDSTIFVATGAGLIVSYNLGKNWYSLTIRESNNSYWDSSMGISSVLVVGDTLWVSSSDGLARSLDWGRRWELFKGVHRVKTLDTGNRNIGISAEYDYKGDSVKTYAFPNPFTPGRRNTDYSRTRIQYALEKDASVTIKIFDYSGRLLKEIVADEYRTGGRDYQEIWDGTDGNGSIVPNGVYFYRIQTNKGDSALGKIIVLD